MFFESTLRFVSFKLFILYFTITIHKLFLVLQLAMEESYKKQDDSDESTSSYSSITSMDSVKDEESSEEFSSRIEPLILKLSDGYQSTQLQDLIDTEDEQGEIHGREDVDTEEKEEGEDLVFEDFKDTGEEEEEGEGNKVNGKEKKDAVQEEEEERTQPTQEDEENRRQEGINEKENEDLEEEDEENGIERSDEEQEEEAGFSEDEESNQKSNKEIDSSDKMSMAYDAVIKNKKTIRGAAEHYGVPYTSLHRRIRNGKNTPPPGRSKYLTEEEESILVSYCIFRAVRGCPLSREEFIDAIQDSLNKTSRITKFKENRPSRKWFDRFKKRHRLSLRKAEDLDGGRTRV